MRQTEWNALTNVTTRTSALLLSNGTKFLFMDTQRANNGGYVGQTNQQQLLTTLRHKIMYYVRDTSSTIGYYPVYDILESDIGTQQTKTSTRRGLTTNAARDDDDRHNRIINNGSWT